MIKRDLLITLQLLSSIWMPTAVSFLTNAPILRNNKAGGVADHNNCCSSAHLTQCNALFTASNYWLFTGQVFSKYRQQFERVEQYGGGGDPYSYERIKYLEEMLQSAVPNGDILNYERNYKRNRGSFRQNYNNFNNNDNSFDRRGYDSSTGGRQTSSNNGNGFDRRGYDSSPGGYATDRFGKNNNNNMNRGGGPSYKNNNYPQNQQQNFNNNNNQRNQNGGSMFDNNGRSRNLLQRNTKMNNNNSYNNNNGNDRNYDDFERRKNEYRRERYDNNLMHDNNSSNNNMNEYYDRGGDGSYDQYGNNNVSKVRSRGARSFYNSEKNPSNNNTFYNSNSRTASNRMSYNGSSDPNFGSLSQAPPGAMNTFNNMNNLGSDRNFGGTTHPYNLSSGD